MRRLISEKKKPRVSISLSEQLHLTSIAEDLSRHLGTKTLIKKDGKKGKVEIEFYGNDDLERLVERLKQTSK